MCRGPKNAIKGVWADSDPNPDQRPFRFAAPQEINPTLPADQQLLNIVLETCYFPLEETSCGVKSVGLSLQNCVKAI